MIGFQPILPQSGYSGWRFLERTLESQKTVFEKSPELNRDIEYFKEHIRHATSAEDLVNDRRLLKVALGAFGLEGDLDKRAYVLKALVEGTDSEDAFANRMVDKRYQQLAKAFGYGNVSGARVSRSDFSDGIVKSFTELQFEVAVGDGDNSMRMAMVFMREIGELSNSKGANGSAWFTVMGNPPMRTLFESAFGLPDGFGSLDVDRQREILKEKNTKMFGSSSLSVFGDPENIEKLIRTYFVRQQLSENMNGVARGSAALTLIKSSAAGMAQFFQSRL